MKNVKWLLEKDVFEDNHDKLVQTIKSLGMQAKVCQYVPFDGIERIVDLYSKDDCVVFYGSLNLGEHLMKRSSWVPGVYLKKREYECTSYYPILGNILLHQNYIMLPYGDLIRQKSKIFDTYFQGYNKVFMRPNSGAKEFTGMVVPKWDYEECIKLAGFYNVDPDMMVLISTVESIEKEWRFVVVNQKIVSGSLYRDWSFGEKRSTSVATRDYVLMNSHSLWEGCQDQKAWDIAQLCATKYNPDPCWTIDVALTEDGKYSVLEIGCFSCAGLYGNDLNIVVQEVSKAALAEWKDLMTNE